MTQPLLSILIPTVVGREENLIYLLNRLCNNYPFSKPVIGDITYIYPHGKDGEVIEVRSFKDGKQMTIGEKRENMYKAANGLYSWQIDDDDDISDNAIELILEAIKQNPDCITFEEYVNIDGTEFKSNHSLTYFDWDGDGQGLFPDGFHYHRTPFFKSVIKTSIAQSVPIPRKRWGEDHEWARLLKPHLVTEIHIPEQIYKYIHISSNHVERYGLDKD